MVMAYLQYCSQGTKYWLTGYHFEDDSVVAQDVTNAEFMNILNPQSDEYRDYFNFVYDTESYDFCSDYDLWFS
jgi:hypothetical protein